MEENRLIEVVTDESQTDRGIQLEDGRIVNVYRKDGSIHRFDEYFDLVTGEIYPEGVHPEGTVCFNDLIAEGKAKEVHCYESCDFDMEDTYPGDIKLDRKLYKEIQQYFKDHGYNVTISAISFCLKGWENICDTGYRDEKHGYHLFSPEGFNPLSIRLTTLHDLCKDWQKTYVR